MCPTSAITIVDTRQAYNAVIDEEKCIHCGICTNVCQNNKETTLKPVSYTHLDVYKRQVCDYRRIPSDHEE